jgi:hypothetical protein
VVRSSKIIAVVRSSKIIAVVRSGKTTLPWCVPEKPHYRGAFQGNHITVRGELVEPLAPRQY